MIFKTFSVVIVFLAVLFWLSSCSDTTEEVADKKELLIYCGITMEKPIRELALQFEQQEDCLVKIMIEGSGTLYRTLIINRSGDLYLPGSETYINKAQSDGVISETHLVGYNRAALIVAKGNPLGISAEVKNLTDRQLRTVLGAAESGSIGKESRKILETAGLHDAALGNAVYLTSDSKGLTQAIIAKEADLTMNWQATACWPENNEFIDTLQLDENTAPPHPLIISLLNFSKEPELAKKLFDFISSEDGLETFEIYGFGRRAICSANNL